MVKLAEVGLNSSVDMGTLEGMLRDRVKGWIAEVLDAEVKDFMARMNSKLADGKASMIRNGYHNPRTLSTGLGPIEVKVPRTRNRAGCENFKSVLIPAYKRGTSTFNEAVCYFYLKGFFASKIVETLEKLFGSSLSNLSPATLSRLIKKWRAEHEEWSQRRLDDKDYCYLWADGIHFNVRGSDEKLCILVVIGATADGRKELIAIEGGYRESKESWSVLLGNLKARGMKDPKLCVADGALGFWAAANNVYPQARHQRCWVHKTANILDKMPRKTQGKAKSMIHAIYMAATKKQALDAHKLFIKTFTAKYPGACKCLDDHRDSMFAFFDFPAEHWRHIRTSNPIESTFATVRLRMATTRGNGSMETTLAMAFKLVMEAAKGWRCLNGSKLITKLYQGIIFKDGVEVKAA